MYTCLVLGADISASDASSNNSFRYPSYVQHIMGDIFSLGFGPFRWVCCSCDPNDLDITDILAADVLERLMASGGKSYDIYPRL